MEKSQQEIEAEREAQRQNDEAQFAKVGMLPPEEDQQPSDDES